MNNNEVTLEVVISKDLEKMLRRHMEYVGVPLDDLITVAIQKELRSPTIVRRTAYLERVILDIIGAFPDGIHTSMIHEQLEKKIGSIVSIFSFGNRINTLCVEKKKIERKRQGIYVLKDNS